MEVRNARYIDDTRIDCEINHPVHGWIPYTLDPNDTDMTVDNVALRKAMGDKIAPYIPPSPAEVSGQMAAQIRGQRDMLLAQSDWTQTPDAPVDQAAWATYRQALRDIPQQPGFPDNVTWPTAP
jgi:hypothetical protein